MLPPTSETHGSVQVKLVASVGSPLAAVARNFGIGADRAAPQRLIAGGCRLVAISTGTAEAYRRTMSPHVVQPVDREGNKPGRSERSSTRAGFPHPAQIAEAQKLAREWKPKQ
jgi:hypothetical protein